MSRCPEDFCVIDSNSVCLNCGDCQALKRYLNRTEFYDEHIKVIEIFHNMITAREDFISISCPDCKSKIAWEYCLTNCKYNKICKKCPECHQCTKDLK